MDKHNRYMTKDAGRSIVLERQQRISIEGNSRMLIKNTQTQVRELYRRDNRNRDTRHSLKAKKSSSLGDTRIMATRLQVDALNKQIENEIGRLKYFRDYFLRPGVKTAALCGPNTSNASSQQKRKQINQICRRNLNAAVNNNDNNHTTIDKVQDQDTNPTFSLNIPGATPRPEVQPAPTFRTLGVKPLSNEEKGMIDTTETTDPDVNSDEVSRQRISGGCNFSHCSVYQQDYGQSGISPHLGLPVSSPLTSPLHYQGRNRCCCCECQQRPAVGNSSPVSFQYSQYYPNVQHYYICSTPQPKHSRRVSDLNTEDFCRHWCRNVVDSRSPSHERSSRTTATRDSTRAATTPRSRSLSKGPPTGKGRLDHHLKNKLKDAGVTDSSSLAHYKVQEYEKITKVTLRKQLPAADRKMSRRSDNERMHITDYVPAKTRPEGKDPATSKKKTAAYNKYTNEYEKGHQKSWRSSSPLDVESTPTYTKIQEKSPTPTNRTYGPPRGKPPTQSNQSRASRDSSKSSKLPPSTKRLAEPHQSGYKNPSKLDDKSSDSARRTKDVSPSIPSAPKQKYRQSIDKTPKVQSESDSAKRTKRLPSPTGKQEYRQSIDKTSKVQSESDSAQRNKRIPSPTGNQEHRQSMDTTPKVQSESDSAQRTKRLPSSSAPKQEEYRQSIDKTYNAHSESDSSQRTKRVPSPTPSAANQEYRPSIDRAHAFDPEDLADQGSRDEMVPKENHVDQSQRLQDVQSNGEKEEEAMKPKTDTDQKEIPSLDEGREESTKFIENQPQGASTSNAYKSPKKESSPDALRDKHDDQPSRRPRDNTSNESMTKGTTPSDSGNQPQTNYNRQPMAEIKSDPSDGRGIEGADRLSLASKPISAIPEKRMELAAGEVASTTSICHTWSQRRVSIKRPEQEGGSYLRRETQRFNKECVRYITTDIGPDAKISQTSTQKRELSTQGTQTMHENPSMAELDSPYPQQDGRLSTPIPKKLEERLTQTEILNREERPTQTELLEANREERRTQTEPNERHERLTQTDLLTKDRNERLTQTELQEMPQNEAKGHVKESSPSPKNVSGDRHSPQKRNLQPPASPRQSIQNGKAQIHQPPKGQQTKDSNPSNQQQGKPKQPLQSAQQRAAMSNNNVNGAASSAKGQKPLHTASSQNQQPPSSKNYSQKRASYPQTDSQAKSRQLAARGVHQVPIQHDLKTEQRRAAPQSQLERRSHNDPEEIMCPQYDREDLQIGEIAYRQAVPGSHRYPNDQIPSNRSRCGQINYSCQSGEPLTNRMQGSMPQSYINSYKWCGGATYAKYANTERCTTFTRSAMQRSIDSNDDIPSSETDLPCCSYIDDDSDYNGDKSQAPSSPYCRQQPQRAHNPQKEEMYSQYSMANSVQVNVIPISAYTRHSRPHQHQHVANLMRVQEIPRDSCKNTNKTAADKRSRTVKFNDQNDEICPVQTQRSTIDWEKAYQDGLLSDKMHFAQLNESTGDDETCRSNSSINTDVTCIGSTCEDEYISCDEEDFFKHLPPFKGCPCMIDTYYNLASMGSDR